MARPVKNNCDYFPHDANMRNHRKVKAIRNTYPNGYAIWVMLLEYLTFADGNEFEDTDFEYELLSGDFGFTATEIRDVVNYCIKLEMLFLNNGFVSSDSLNERLEPVYKKRGKAKELSKKQQRINGKYVASNTEQTGVSVTETPQTKGNKSKEEESKQNPTLFGEPEGSEEKAPVLPDKYFRFLAMFNKHCKREFRTMNDKAQRQLDKLIKKKFSKEDFEKAISQGYLDSQSWVKPELFSPEYITREDKFELYLYSKSMNGGTTTPPKQPKKFSIQQQIAEQEARR